MRFPAPIWNRLLKARVITPTGCWEWPKYRDKQGYGRISVLIEGKRKCIGVHRLVAHLEHGMDLSQPRKIYACHECDNPPCFNPDHVFVGTAQQNSDDAKAKGRIASTAGERNKGGGNKLTATDVVEIRSLRVEGRSQSQIAARFGIDQTMVSLILRGKKWRHVA